MTRLQPIDPETATGKTKEINKMFKSLKLLKNNGKADKILFVAGKSQEVRRAARNIDGLTIEPAQNLNTYEVLNSNSIVFEKNALSDLEKLVEKN